MVPERTWAAPRMSNPTDVLPLEPLHRFHSYCARFPSEIVESAIRQFTAPGDSIYDPFCGSGTSLVAGLAHQRVVVGSDIDVLAGMLSEVKCSPASPERYGAWRGAFAAELARTFEHIRARWPPTGRRIPGRTWKVGALELELPRFSELNYWFPPQLTAFLAAIAAAAHRCGDPHLERVALVSLSASIIAKWPNTLSYAMDIDHTRPHRRVQRFTSQRVLATYLSRLDRTIDCLSALHQVYRRTGGERTLPERWRVLCPHDARHPSDQVPAESQNLIVTSPPYFDAVDYPRAHRMAVCWMNGHAPAELASRRSYIGLHQNAGLAASEWLGVHPEVKRLIPEALREGSRGRRIVGFFADLESALAQMKRVLRPGGHAVVVIGDNTLGGHVLRSHQALVGLARRLGFVILERKARQIEKLRRRFPVGPFGFDGPMTHEHVLVLHKPLRSGATEGSG
ncbi:MAG TPA: DNA methyltransferase [Longimicrobiaceae bacterium]|nr:DNA methyltransferase [Longimicrobiaceae bacterium]